MKVLVISPKFHPVVGGGETFAQNSVEQLRSAGIDVCVAAEPNTSRKLQDYSYTVHQIAGLSDTNLDIVKAADGLFQLIQDFQPDILHVHGYFALMATELSNSNEIPIVASVHSTPVWGQRIIGGMSDFAQEVLFARNVIRFAHPKVITAANSVYAKAAEKLISGNTRIMYLPYPILPTFYNRHDGNYFRGLFNIPEASILITVPSRIIERKGIREAVEALALLPENYMLCLPCASSPLDLEYWSSIRASKHYKSVSSQIVIPKYDILHEDMPKLYAASNIIAMPSYYEGAPVATVETMASQRPFVGADSQGINDFITHGVNGMLVPKKNPKALAETIHSLVQDKQLQKKLTKNASKSVNELSWEIQLGRLIKMYEKLAN